MPHIRHRRSLARLLFVTLASALVLALAGLLAARPAQAVRAGAASPVATPAGWSRGGPPAGHVSALAVSPSSPSTAYLYLNAAGKYYDTSPSGLFKTTDAGAHWVRTGYPALTHWSLRVEALAIDPANPAVVYAGTRGDGIYKSTDGGATWAGPYGDKSEVASLVADPATPGTLYVSHYGRGVYKSTDGGVTWVSSSTGISFFGVNTLRVDPSNPSVVYATGGDAGPGQFGGVFKSTNRGANWTRVTSGLPHTSVAAVAIDPSNTSTLYLGTSLGVFKSTDGGANWAAVGAGLPAGSTVVSLAVRPGATSTVFAVNSSGGIHRSTDAGASWAPAVAADTRFDAVVADATGAHIYAGSYGLGLLKSGDGGATFGPSNEGLPFAAVRRLVVDPNNPAAVIAGAGDDLYRSGDGGESWGTAGLFQYSRPIMGLVADPTSPATFYAAPDYVGVLKTTDGGAKWTLVRGADNVNVHALAIAPSAPRTLYLSRLNSRLSRSTDGGATWSTITSPAPNAYHLAVDPADASVVYAATSFGIYKSVNGGQSWGRLNAFDMSGDTFVNGFAIDPSSPSTVYAFAKGAGAPVRKSTDGGASWAAAAAGIPATTPGVFEVSDVVTDPVNPSVLYAACLGAAEAGGGVYRSTDGGASWGLFESALDAVNSLALDPSGMTLYAGTDRGVFKAQTPPRPLAFAAGRVTAGEAAGAVNITVSRTDAAGPLSVNYATADGSATAGADYAATSGVLTFAPGEAAKTFSVNVLDDAVDEFEEGVRLTITADGGAAVLARATLTILDDDQMPALTVGDLSAPEGDFDTTEFVFRLSLSAPSAKHVTLNVNTAPGGTATFGVDLFNYAGPYELTFAPGETEKTVSVSVRGDLDIEPDETFFLDASNVSHADPADTRGVGTILNDDAAPTVALSINDVSVVEGNTGELTDAVFTVTLSGPTTKTVRVDYLTSAGGAGTEYQFAAGTLSFAPGETMKNFAVRVIGDLRFEPDEQFEVRLQNPRNALIGDGIGILTIINDEPAPTLSVSDVTVTEGNAGLKEATFVVTLSVEVETQVAFDYTAAPGTATQNEDYLWAGGAALFSPGVTRRNITVQVKGDTVAEPDENFFLRISNATNGAAIADGEGVCTILDDDGVNGARTFQFSQSQYSVAESGGHATITVTRGGDLSAPASVEYSTERSNNSRSASERSDYTHAEGTLSFAPGEAAKTFRVLITDDVHAERDPRWGDEFVDLVLRNPSAGFTLGAPHTALLTIVDNDAAPGGPNPADDSRFYVRQHYYDFLNRVPDDAGLQFWAGQIEECGPDAGCREARRVNVSAAFFLSIEFQETGYLVYRTYKAAYGDATSPPVPGTVPVVRLREFLRDTQQLGRGVEVGVGNWFQQLEANKNAYVLEFVRQPRFADLFPAGMTAEAFVSKLDQNAGGVLSAGERAELERLLGPDASAAAPRAEVLRRVAEHAELRRRETNRAFVLMQYFGYLRRNPDDPQDVDFRGWRFWLDKLDEHRGDFVAAEMVRAFILSIEYRHRFGQ